MKPFKSRETWAVDQKRKSELAIMVFGSIIGFGVLIAVLLLSTPH